MNCTLGRNDQYPFENFKRGARVWIKDTDRVWICGELIRDLSFASKFAEVRLAGEEENRVYDMLKSGLPFPCNPDILLGSNDLTSLSYLHEPAVLHNLRHRFVERRAIYTYCGIVLVAINPYADCAHLYGDEVIQIYRNERDDIRKLDPHIYGIAEEAYADLCEYRKDQSVIISGESGAGKTVSAKFVMRYLASVASDDFRSISSQLYSALSSFTPPEAGDKIENRVLASNPIMEAIGNAKTIRNDNSSRFGKFIQINFASRSSGSSSRTSSTAAAFKSFHASIAGELRISGAEMKTYLLEKSRVVSHSTNERNYHIFYQMCAAAAAADSSSDLKACLNGLDLLDVCDFNYLHDSANPASNRIENVDDKQEFSNLLRAFQTLKISEHDQRDIFRILAGILFLGNVRFEANADGDARIRNGGNKFVMHLCSSNLYDVNSDKLSRWLITREIRAGRDVVSKSLSVEEASANRDALAKVLYACLFDWIVERINENLMSHNESGNEKSSWFIGVLDIYGFETFERNSFEQFCINYANEKLQQQFNQHVFKLEQGEYERERISWDAIEFEDNQLCINLIESRPGIIDYLDEQCKTGRGTDAAWLERMRGCPVLRETNRLFMPKIREAAFVVKHFASDVSYQIDGFIEKNKDTVNEQLLHTIGKTKNQFLHFVVKDALASSSTGVRRKRTVAVQFRDSLARLIGVLSATRPHYVRCIKPNDGMHSFHFDAKRTIQQLRANGVLETVRISAAGFPSRWTYEDFAIRYSLLLPLGKRRVLNARDFARVLCETYLDSGKFALGESKIFLRTGQVACIERLRNEKRFDAAVQIQSFVRGVACRRRFLRLRSALCHIQAFTRAALVYRYAHYLRMHRAACMIQYFLVKVLRRRRRERLQVTILHLQSHIRGNIIRQRFVEVRRNFQQRERIRVTVLQLQAHFRGNAARRRFMEMQALLAANVSMATASSWSSSASPDLSRAGSLKSACHSTILNEDLRRDAATTTDSETSENLTRLLLEQQKLIADLRKRADENRRTISRLKLLAATNMLNRSSDYVSANTMYDLMKIQDFELTISKNKSDIQKLSEQGDIQPKFMQILERHWEENERLRDENIHLRAILAKMFERQTQEVADAISDDRGAPGPSTPAGGAPFFSSSKRPLSMADSGCGASGADGSDDDMHSFAAGHSSPSEMEMEERIELERYVRHYRLLLDSASRELFERDDQILQLQTRLSLMHNDADTTITNDSSFINGVASTAANSSQLAATNAALPTLESLVQENLILQRDYERKSDELVEARAYLCGYSTHLTNKDGEKNGANFKRIEMLKFNGVAHSALLEVNNVPEFSRILVYDIRPRIAKRLQPCLQSYLLLMAFRFYDHTFDDVGMTNLFESVHAKLLEYSRTSEDVDVLALWLANSWRLLNLLRQYGSDETSAPTSAASDATCDGEDPSGWRAQNTIAQRAQAIRRFDLEPLRNQLKLRVQEFYSCFMKRCVEPLLKPKIVPAILQHESYEFVSENFGNGKLLANTKKSESDAETGKCRRSALEDLTEFLDIIHSRLCGFGADGIIIEQVFRQIVKWIVALALNTMMFRRDLCTPDKAISIKHNITQIQCWLVEKCADARVAEIVPLFEPLIQASHLLQLRKSADSLDVLCGEMTSRLWPKQIIAILRHFTPSANCCFAEDIVDERFLLMVEEKLSERTVNAEKNELLMHGTYLEPFDTRPFVYSDVALETIILPKALNFKSVSRFI